MPDRRTIRITTAEPEQTRNLGRHIAQTLLLGDVVLLHGDLGAGKTTLVQGIAAGLGIVSMVQSPTFVLIHEHAGQTADGTRVALRHLDLFRLSGTEEVEAVGYGDHLAPDDGITIVEWPERAGSLLPDHGLLVDIRTDGGNERTFVFRAIGSDEDAARWMDPLIDLLDRSGFLGSQRPAQG